ncbi:MAG: Gfo/Idh/MocA family oxidoreductase [Caldilineaceae bacterium]
MNNRMINIGVIGTGGMGGRHVRNLTNEVAGAQVVALMDVDQARLQDVAVACGATHTFTDGNALINHPAVDAVLIAAPDRFHASLTQACIAVGKPVFCEKPLAMTADEAYKVIEAEVAGGRRLVQLGFMREYDPAHVRVKQMIDSGQLGQAVAFRGVHINPPTPEARQVAEVITNSVVHDIHSARWLMNDEIVRVYTSFVPCAPDQPDTAQVVLVQLHYRNGAIGQIECNADSGYGYEVDVKMTGTTGAVQTTSLQSALVSRSNQRGQWVEEDWLQRFETAYIIEAKAWINALQKGQTTGPSAWDGYVAMLVADACIESVRSGQAVAVNIPATPAIYGKH